MKKRQVVLYIVLMIIMITTTVYATISSELNLKFSSKSDKFYAGDEFNVTIGLKNVDSEKGIKSIEGYIDIDENVLEDITIENIVKDENGKVKIDEKNILSVYDVDDLKSDIGIVLNTNPISEKGDYKLVINLDNSIKTDIDLVTLKFKIKDDVSVGTHNTVMSYSLFTVYADDASGKVELAKKSYKIDISDKADLNNTPENNAPTNNAPVNNAPVNNAPVNNTPVNNTPVNNTPVNNAPVNNTPVNNAPVNNAPVNNASENKASENKASLNKQSPNNTLRDKSDLINQNKQDLSTSPTNLPKTGVRLLLIPIIVITIVGLVFYKKYSKYNKYNG